MSSSAQSLFGRCATVVFTVPYEPIPQPRGKIVLIGPKEKKQPRVVVPDKHPVHQWRWQVVDAWKLTERPIFPREVPLFFWLTVVVKRPDRMRWKRRPMPRVRDTRQVGDFDNYAKAVCDALEGFAYHNDSQIAEATVTRWIASGDEEPHARIEIAEITV